ncbi:MAG TPA: substrate-binding domain-containing protein [Ramlibacter sp.]|nr:substrate-binding domain-containing protein [Ramlibacter sp.]
MTVIQGISSMATRQLLGELAAAYEQQAGAKVAIESVGGVTAAKRVEGGEAFDAIFLAADAVDRLVAAGAVLPGSRVDLFRSGVAIGVPTGQPQPDIASEEAVKQAVLAAPTVGYSTGPSGTALLQLFERWGIRQRIERQLVQAPAGVPVAALVGRGEIALGFQQWSEMLNVPGVTIVGPLPEAIQITTTFSGGVCAASQQPDAVRALLGFLASPAAADTIRRNGMTPA